MKDTVSQIAAQIADCLCSSSHALRSYSERAHDYLYNKCIDEHREQTRGALTWVRAGSLHDKAECDLIIALRDAVDTLLTEHGYERSDYGYWHAQGEESFIAYERTLRELLSGTVFAWGDCGTHGYAWITGEGILSDYSTLTEEYPSSPLEALDFWLSDPEVDFYGNHETEWSWVVEHLREMFEQLDLTEYEDVDEALACLDCGLFISDFPVDYQESVTRLFDEAKAEQQEEGEYED